MTFQTATYAVDGNTESGNFLRLMLQSATLGSQGCVGHLDCQVNANSPATPGIIITPGAVVVVGNEANFQGSYYGYNIGNDTTLSIAATGGSPRSDMIVIRAEDPTWSGSTWTGPAAGQILFPRVLSNVGAGATAPPGGISAIPLARIDMPASTSTVAQGYIHDLRYVCTPQRIMQTFVVNGPTNSVTGPSTATPVQWPTGASWQVFIPAWATTMVLSWQVNGLLTTSTIPIGYYMAPIVGSSVTSPVLTTPQSFLYNNFGLANGQVLSMGGGGNIAIGPSLRGTTQTIQFATQTNGTDTGTAYWWKTGAVSITVEFQQLAATI